MRSSILRCHASESQRSIVEWRATAGTHTTMSTNPSRSNYICVHEDSRNTRSRVILAVITPGAFCTTSAISSLSRATARLFFLLCGTAAVALCTYPRSSASKEPSSSEIAFRRPYFLELEEVLSDTRPRPEASLALGDRCHGKTVRCKTLNLCNCGQRPRSPAAH